MRKRRRNPKKKWIRKAIKRPGALRKKFSRWYGLKKDQKISASMYARGYKRAKARGDTRTMRQINLARNLAKMSRKRRAKPKLRVIKGRRVRAKAANPSKKFVAGKDMYTVKRHAIRELARLKRKGVKGAKIWAERRPQQGEKRFKYYIARLGKNPRKRKRRRAA
jgi:hypothetical protein